MDKVTYLTVYFQPDSEQPNWKCLNSFRAYNSSKLTLLKSYKAIFRNICKCTFCIIIKAAATPSGQNFYPKERISHRVLKYGATNYYQVYSGTFIFATI